MLKNHKRTFAKSLKAAMSLMVILGLITSCGKKAQDNSNTFTAAIPVTGELIAELTSPPNVPAPVGDRGAQKLIVNMEILEEVGEMTDGVEYVYWTFGGSVPGSFIRTRVGDEVEFHLKNHPNNK
jgi:nitrite reductase (NO-forming)